MPVYRGEGSVQETFGVAFLWLEQSGQYSVSKVTFLLIKEKCRWQLVDYTYARKK